MSDKLPPFICQSRICRNFVTKSENGLKHTLSIHLDDFPFPQQVPTVETVEKAADQTGLPACIDGADFKKMGFYSDNQRTIP